MKFLKNMKTLLQMDLITRTRLNMLWNLCFGAFEFFLAYTQRSYWYFTLGVFFLILGIARGVSASKHISENKKIRVISFQLAFLSIVICGMTFLTIDEVRYPIANKNLVIGQAAFAFTLIGMAIYNVIISHVRKQRDMIFIRDLSLAAAIGSILSLQRTMLGTFGDPSFRFNTIMEASTGMGAFLILLFLAFRLYRLKKK